MSGRPSTALGVFDMTIPCVAYDCHAVLVRTYWVPIRPRDIRRAARLDGWSVKGSDDAGWHGRCPEHRGRRLA